VGADVRDVILGLGYDKRIGFEFMKPGPGWGGSCLPKDTRALVHIAEQAGYDFSFLKGAIATNDEQFERVVSKVRTAVAPALPAGTAEGDFTGAVVAVWGLTFKAGTDDLRNSPAVEVSLRLAENGAEVRAFDPTVTVPDGAGSVPVPGFEVPEGPGSLSAYPDAYTACQGASVVVVLTEWDEFRWLDFAKVRDVLAAPVFVDARNLLDPAQVRRLGFSYVGIGRR